MPRAVPETLGIPAIGVRARVIALGLDARGGVAVPPLSTPFLVGWYDLGAAPGQAGAAVLLGHVDAAAVGPAVFYLLGKMRPGNRVYVTRADRKVAEFRVTSVALYPQEDFPASLVYAKTRQPTLRLITCGGQFDRRTHLYLGSTIVFADFVTALPAGAGPGNG